MSQHAMVTIFRPSDRVVNEISDEIAECLSAGGFSGTIDDSETITRMYNNVFEYCSKVVDDNLPAVHSIDLMMFLLSQRASMLENPVAYEGKEFTELAFEYLLERMISGDEFPFSSKEKDFCIVSKLVFATECMVKSASWSDAAHSLHPGRYRVDFQEKDGGIPVLKATNRLDVATKQFIEMQRKPYSAYRQFLEPTDVSDIQNSLDPEFLDCFGVTLSDILRLALRLSEYCKENANIAGIHFCRRRGLLEATETNTGLRYEYFNKPLDALILSWSDSRKSKRLLYKSGQDWRVLRKPFIELEFEGEAQLLWSRAMVRRSVLYVLQEIGFGRVPDEWADCGVVRSASQLSQKHDKIWEKIVYEELMKRGLWGEHDVEDIAFGDETLHPPGQIDCLMWDPADNAIVIVECKRTQPSYTPYHYRYDLQNYARRRRSHLEVVKDKVRWIYDNCMTVVRFLTQQKPLPTDREMAISVKAVIITKYPSFAMTAGDVVGIYPLAEILEYKDENNIWMFSTMKTINVKT